MNTPPKPKTPVRFGSKKLTAKLPTGTLHSGIRNDTIAQALGRIAGLWPHAEEAMIRLLAAILVTDETAARQIFRSIVNQHARIAVTRNLLENIPQAVDLGTEADDAIREFEALNGCRNLYLHGIWLTDVGTGKVYLAEADTTHFVHLPTRRVTEKELAQIHARIEALQLGLHRYVNDLSARRAWEQHRKRVQEKRRALTRKLP